MTKPDFSGQWTLNLQASRLSSDVAASVQSGALRIQHREPTFASQMTIVFSDKPVESKFELVADGREVTGTGGGQQVVSSLRWDGEALVANFRIQLTGGDMVISFRYELLDGGRRLRAAEQLRGAGRDQDNLWIFDRS